MEKRVSPLDQEDVMKIRELAEKLKVSNNTVTRWCNKSYFPNAFRVGSSWRIPLADVENFILQTTAKEKKEEQ